MKNQLARTFGKKAFTVLVAFVIFFSSSPKIYAFADSASAAAKFNAISYQGLRDKSLVFKVDYKNELAQKFQLVIKGEQSEILYRKWFDANPLNTTILLSELPENCKLTFEIQTPGKDYSQTFQINTQVKTVQEYIVKGL